ncbi:PLP-dependent aspartate aminotransferase family protein [uncultured Oscillibacter sp.]|uniref:trans-sulfuration enzyme family protein n=1 Tax=uncultured Oscillibacter sp. TaxID=876091 RepID=UPI00261C3E36|nr:PLP-dependent aspartate aminotransferase family protein [uncultured Oscillibacter sp.]
MSKGSLKDMALETLLVHGGHKPDPATRSLAVPIYQTATYGFDTVDEMNASWDRTGLVYSREGSPTVYALEEKLALLEGGEAALCASSGMGAICSALLSVLKRGEHLLCSEEVFSHTGVFVKEFLVDKMGVDVSYADFRDVENVMQNIRSNTAVLYTETPSNPSLGLVNIQAISRIAKENDCLFIVDSTFAPPPIQRPLELGADLVIHSLTKYINGHGDTLGGAIIGPKSIIENIHFPGMPCFTGACLSPFNAWLIMRGMMTLDMRIQRHCENALAIASFLEQHPLVDLVNYPALPSHPQYALCQSQMHGMGGGIVSFWLKKKIGGLELAEANKKLLDSTRLMTIATSLGEGCTLIQIEHSGMIRIAVGLENKDDLLRDLSQALDSLAG